MLAAAMASKMLNRDGATIWRGASHRVSEVPSVDQSDKRNHGKSVQKELKAPGGCEYRVKARAITITDQQ
jgi:hypothetical protein